jgi:hypothetical protein
MKSKERAYMSAVASLGCCVCHNQGTPDSPAAIHHIRHGAGMSERSSNYLVIPLCGPHHQTGGHGVAIHAGRETWEGIYGNEMQLLAQTIGRVFNAGK